MRRMTALEYKQIFSENHLNRSEIVRTLEDCIRTLNAYAITLANEGEIDQALFYQEQAEEAKWLAIFTAMNEKEQGWGYLEQIQEISRGEKYERINQISGRMGERKAFR